jgi:hypothetical protein
MIMPSDRRAATRWDAYVQPLRELLRHRQGMANAITLDEVVPALGLPNRRAAEQLLEDHVGRLGFVVVAGGPGLWRPTSAQEINAYRGSLRRRHVALKDREEAITTSALMEGWRMLGDEFSEPPTVAPDLFSVPTTTERRFKGES